MLVPWPIDPIRYRDLDGDVHPKEGCSDSWRCRVITILGRYRTTACCTVEGTYSQESGEWWSGRIVAPIQVEMGEIG